MKFKEVYLTCCVSTSLINHVDKLALSEEAEIGEGLVAERGYGWFMKIFPDTLNSAVECLEQRYSISGKLVDIIRSAEQQGFQCIEFDRDVAV